MTHTFKLARRMSRFRAVPFVSALLLAAACDNSQIVEPTEAKEVVTPSLAVSGASSVTISNLSVGSGKTYHVITNIAAGSKLYSDRAYTFDAPLPSAVQGLTYIQTANADKDAAPGSSSFLSFDISADATVYVAHDNRLPRPAWLTSGFQDTGLDLLNAASATKLSLFKRSFVHGRVTLGSNVTAPANRSMYVVLVAPATGGTPAPAPPPPPPPSSSSTGSPPPASSAPGIPFGVFGLPMEEYANTSTWTASLKHLSPSGSAITELAAAKKYGAHVVVSLAGGRSTYQNSDHTFSMTKWKANIDKWRSIGITPYINDGTIIGSYLVDEPNWAGGWGGKLITQAELEEMARYSKSIWPGMATAVRVRAGYLIGFAWHYLDFGWAQWEGPLHLPSLNMTPEVWRDKEIADAQRAGVKLMFGMNFLDGGDGSSGISGTYDLRTVKTRWQMTAAEVERVGKALASASYACGVINWQWSLTLPVQSYMTSAQLAGIRNLDNRADVKTALARVAAVARNRSTMSCKR